uniref:Uncharacterized protein n=1 Tax=Rhizophora mucronata TaxID=61149 RepID=A0A2P2MSP9_RHIMU
MIERSKPDEIAGLEISMFGF